LKRYSVAVVGASGAVGEELFRVLEEQNFPVTQSSFPIGQSCPVPAREKKGLEIPKWEKGS